VLHIDGVWFKDEQGRVRALRGVNLSGASKIPVKPNGATHNLADFFDHRHVSFVGRPFPLAEADEHFARMRAWGLTFLRLVITWEAVEHRGPGEYDEAYLDYLVKIVRRANDYGIHLFIDPHQDVWSRFSGGSGAPGWTFEIVGMDITHFHQTRAALVHQTHGDPFPRMVWASNSVRLAAATMATLFFAGNDFAPATSVDDVPVQEFLQSRYIQAMQQVAERMKDMPNVLGFGTMNEPIAGYIGHKDLRHVELPVRSDIMPTPYQSMLLGAGYWQNVPSWQPWNLGIIPIFKAHVNPDGVRAWLDGYDCIWKQNGVWDIDQQGKPHLLQPHYFATVNGRKVDFAQDYLLPFLKRYAAGIHEVNPEAFIFAENEAFHQPPTIERGEINHLVHAPHWYDVITLHQFPIPRFVRMDTYQRRIVIGTERVRRSFEEQLGRYKCWSRELMGGVPTVIGEIGIPFDLNMQYAYRTGDFSEQIDKLSWNIDALEANLLDFTLWNYTPDNTNERGDLWNGEDFSIFSRDQQDKPADINSGGRALRAVVRPYARAAAGEPLCAHFDVDTAEYVFRYRHDPTVSAPTEFYVPNLQYPGGYTVSISDGEYEIDHEAQRLLYHHTPHCETHEVRIMPNVRPEPVRHTYRVVNYVPIVAGLVGLFVLGGALLRKSRS
jgi:hypothetical protein